MERLFLEFAIRAGLVVLSAAAVLRLLRIKSAAAQHAVWAGVVVVMLALPIWISWGPKARLPVLSPPAEPIMVTNEGSARLIDAPSGPVARPPKEFTAPHAGPATRNWSTALTAAYLIGACMLLLRLAIGTIRANRLTAASCAAPVTVGWFRPRVVLPAHWRNRRPDQLAAILTHERAHARRRDPLFQWLALFNRALFWFHPLAWWLERRLSALAEEACDTAVLESGCDPRDYAQCLLDAAREVQRAGTRVNMVAMAMPGASLSGRIAKIIITGIETPRISVLRMTSAALVCTICSVLFAAGTLAPVSKIQRTPVTGPAPTPSPSRTVIRVEPQPKPADIVLAQVAAPPQAPPPAASPEFEVAVIKQNKSADTQMGGEGGRGGGLIPGGQFTMRNVPLKMLLGYAFYATNQRFADSFIVGTPPWVDSDRFDLLGKAPADFPARECFFSNYCLPDGRLARMIQTFLVSQFHIQDHRVQRPTNIYALVAGKGGPKFQKAAGSGDRNCRRIVGGTDEARELDANQAGFVCRNIDMADLANLLPEMAPAYIDRIVVDSTGLTGTWDFKLTWVGAALIDQGGLTIFDALEKQLGLKLEAQKQPMPVTVIDHIEKLADDN